MKYLIILCLLYSCCPKIVTTTNTTTTIHDTTEVKVIEKQVDTLIDKDTLTQVIQLECDSAGKVHIIGGNVNKGKRSSLNSKLSNNVLYNRFTCDSLIVQLSYKDSIINTLRSKETTIDTTKVVIKKEMPFWGWLLIGAALSFAVYSKFS